MSGGWLARLGRHAASQPRADLPSQPGACPVLARGPSASVDYILEPHLRTLGLQVALVDTRLRPPAQAAATPAAPLAVLVRYLPRGWEGTLRRLRASGTRLVYFMDDDLMDAAAVDELPARYRDRVRREALSQQATIRALCVESWVSTPYLADKYKAWQPQLVAVRPTAATLATHEPVWACYHGTTSHQAELDWLVPVAAALQAQVPPLRLEVFGDHAVYQRFRAIPRVTVLYPMDWPNYLDYTGGVRRQIGLAPLLAGRFNAGRGPVKFFDFARLGAVGVYSDVEPYRSLVRHGVDGLLLPDDPAAWVRTVAELAADAPRRQRMAQAARERAGALAA